MIFFPGENVCFKEQAFFMVCSHHLEIFCFRNVPSGVLLASSFENAVIQLSSHETLEHLENVFIIGGALLYKVI